MAWASTTKEAWGATDLASWSETTRRGIRATDEYLDELELDKSLALAKENGHQEGNLNAGRAVRAEEINLHHPFWAEGHENEVFRKGHAITFDANILSKSTGSAEVEGGETDFVERGDRPLYKVVQIVETAIKDRKTIIPILVSVKDQEILHKIGDIMREIINKLEKGKRYSVSNCTSLRIPAAALNTLCEVYTVYQYFAGISPIYTLGATKKELPPPAKKELPSPEPLLPRLAPRSVYCCSK